MTLNGYGCIDGNLFYLGDADEDAPMMEIRFHNQFAGFTSETKDEIVKAMIQAAVATIEKRSNFEWRLKGLIRKGETANAK